MAISAKSCVADSTKWQRWQLFLWWITLWEMRSACSRRSKKGTFYFGLNVRIEPQVHKKISLTVECVSWTSGIPYANVQTCVGPQCWGLGVALLWGLSMGFVACRCSHLLEQPGGLMVGPWGLLPSSDTTPRVWSWMIFSVLCSRGALCSFSWMSSRWLTLVQPKTCKWKIEQGCFF